MKISKVTTFLLALSLFAVLIASASITPAQAESKQGKEPMGFSQEKATHHFYLLKNGGAVEISAKDPNDAATVKAIQQHLEMQAKAFEKGNFDTPIQVHGKVPDGVPILKKLRKEITFESRQTDTGAVLRMFSINAQAKQAIHDFMKFQITEHNTGDSMVVE
ncbi:MAG TPA: hypothetical protein VN622_01460 [Clostridia bacterium]|nr:hypothetical protein [Clostridia bacterium]